MAQQHKPKASRANRFVSRDGDFRLRRRYAKSPDELRARLRDLRQRREDAARADREASEAIADIAIGAKGILPMEEIAKEAGLKSRASLYNLIAWRRGERPSRH